MQTSLAILFLENLKLKLVDVLEQVHEIIFNLLKQGKKVGKKKC